MPRKVNKGRPKSNVIGKLSYFGRYYQFYRDKEKSIFREALKWLIFFPKQKGDFSRLRADVSSYWHLEQ